MLPPGGGSLRRRLLSWDSGWFLKVAQNGYPHGFTYDSGGSVTGNGLAFFPLYPTAHPGRRTSSASTLRHVRARRSRGSPPPSRPCCSAALGRDARRPAPAGSAPSRIARRVGYALVVAVLRAADVGRAVDGLHRVAVLRARRRAMLLAAYRRGLARGRPARGRRRPDPADRCRAGGRARRRGAASVVRRPQTRRCRERVTAAIAASRRARVRARLHPVGRPSGRRLEAWFKIQTAGWGTTFDFGRSTWAFLERHGAHRRRAGSR